MAREGARATETIPETSPSADSVATQFLDCHEILQRRQNMA